MAKVSAYFAYIGMRAKKAIAVVSFMCVALTAKASADLIIYSLDPGNRYDYFQELVSLSLEKSRPKYGEYVLEYKPGMSYKRILHSMQSNKLFNSVVNVSMNAKERKKASLSAIEYPVLRGLLGYRLCYVNREIAHAINVSSTLDSLKKYTQGVGNQWEEGDILRFNGFKVFEVEENLGGSLDSLYQMVAIGRIDLLCRGVTEVYNEMNRFSHISGLYLDPSITLHYELPFFMHVPLSNTQLRDRLTYGILQANEDGSLNRLWRRHFIEAIDSARLSHRKVIELKNPGTENIGFKYQHFLYYP